MLVFGSKRETLPVTIQQDPMTGLPLLSEREAVLQLILAYLALPYSVTEYGCGKKASLIIDHLLAIGLPAYSMSRLLVLEREMSPDALEASDYKRRRFALTAENLLYKVADPKDERLQGMLQSLLPDVDLTDDGAIKAGPYLLRDTKQVQFETTRSHVSTAVTFWDEDNATPTRLVIDPSLSRIGLFEVVRLRELLGSPDALIFSAPLLGHFRLDQGHLTREQLQVIERYLGGVRNLENVSFVEEAGIVRELTGAEAGSIGDPETWTYANNLRARDDAVPADQDHFGRQELDTGRGDEFTGSLRRLLKARVGHSEDIAPALAELRRLQDECDVLRLVREDANWSKERLEPLADAATVFVYYESLNELVSMLKANHDLLDVLEDEEQLQKLRGIGVRLRRRIEWLGNSSLDAQGRIDGRALTPGFVRATVNTIQQMNRAGLAVFVDKVGNIHGLLVDRESRKDLVSGEKKPAEFCASSILHGSHIDTVTDAGKFDGRLGVLSGIETANVLTDLERYFDLPTHGKTAQFHTHVCAFIGEEMTYTGEGVSMPGSSAVSSCAKVSAIHEMVNLEGDRFGDEFVKMLRELAVAQQQGEIDLVNSLASARVEDLVDVCSEPADFYSPHSFERHIEQGPVLDRAGVPMAMVGTIMGIHQEDFLFKGPQAEWAALELNRRMRGLTREPAFEDVRITVGIIEPCGESMVVDKVTGALHWTIEGELNHAGATPTPDRRDPGVAAARLANRFLHWYRTAFDEELRAQITPLVCNIRLSPGQNRNVIPQTAALTIALAPSTDSARCAIDAQTREDLSKTLEGYMVGTLTRQVDGGGEGVCLSQVESVSFVNAFTEARLTIDLRADSQDTMAAFREQIAKICESIEEEYQATVSSVLMQQLAPSRLQESGQALLMERSYGGSHNPRETELLNDIVKGCVLQFAVTRALLRSKATDKLSLYEHVAQCMPVSWRKRLSRFTSGALHDTCNLAARARELRRKEAANDTAQSIYR